MYQTQTNKNLKINFFTISDYKNVTSFIKSWPSLLTYKFLISYLKALNTLDIKTKIKYFLTFVNTGNFELINHKI